jgi:hypothetical protein
MWVEKRNCGVTQGGQEEKGWEEEEKIPPPPINAFLGHNS